MNCGSSLAGSALPRSVSARSRRRSSIIPSSFAPWLQASAIKAAAKPLGHQVAPPEVTRRPLSEYDRLFGLQVEGAG